MSPEQVEEYLQLPHVAVLSVSRGGRGPIAAPLWYSYTDGVVRIVTFPDSVHGKAMRRVGWATLTVRSEDYGVDRSIEQYANVEGPIEFVDDDILPVIMAARRRYYTGATAEDWINRPVVSSQKVAVLHPDRIAGFYWEESL